MTPVYATRLGDVIGLNRIPEEGKKSLTIAPFLSAFAIIHTKTRFFRYTLFSPFTVSAGRENKRLPETADSGPIVFGSPSGSHSGEYENMDLRNEIKYGRYVTSHPAHRPRVWARGALSFRK